VIHFTAILAQSHERGLAVELLALLSAAGLVALLLRRFNLVTIPGYLVAGAVVGALGVGGSEGQTLGSLATVLLMFIIGLHMDLAGLRAGIVSTALVGAVAAAGAVLLGWPVGVAMGLRSPAALSIAMALSISSTAVVLRLMEQRRELQKAHGRLTFGVLLFQDMLTLGMMASVPLLKAWAGGGGAPGTEGAPEAAITSPWGVLRAIAGITALIGVGRWALPKLLRAAAGSAEVLLVLSAAIALGAAVATAALGFSPELGAFLAGFLLASTPFRYQLAGQLVPLRDLFLALFFTAIGLGLPLHTVAQGWWIILIALAAVLVIKALTMGLAAWVCGSSTPVAAFAALAMAQGSEFSLVLLSQFTREGVVTREQSAYVIAVVVLSLVVTPWMVQWGRRLAPRLSRVRHAPWIRKPVFSERPGPAPGRPLEEKRTLRAVVAGFGPVGRAVADALEKRDVSVTVVELNPRTVERQQGLGRFIVYGDAGNLEVLERAGLDKADFVVLTMPDEDAVLRACRLVRSVRPNVFISARVNALSKGIQAMQQGADHTVVEELATAEAMAAQVLSKLEQFEHGEDTGPKLYELT
jgi:Kef-type K+ transport system membrane component KefB